jgi:hypothetical protein
MAEKDSATIMDFFRQAPTLFAVNPMIGPQVEQFWLAQQQILREAESFSEHWFDRRKAAAETALDVAREMSANGGSNPAASLETMTQWQRHSMERVAEDFREWVELCSRCAGHVATAEVTAEKDGLEKTAKSAASAAKAKHATPV